jgi:hypothetical protein
VNKAEYARHRGITPKQIRRGLALGWISLEPDGSIDPAKADRSWAAATDPAHPRGKTAQPSGTYLDARLAHQLVTNDLNGMRLKERRAQLVNAAAATAAVQMLEDRARASWATWPDRIAADFARDIAVADVERVRKVLGRYVAEQVVALPPLKIDLR